MEIDPPRADARNSIVRHGHIVVQTREEDPAHIEGRVLSVNPTDVGPDRVAVDGDVLGRSCSGVSASNSDAHRKSPADSRFDTGVVRDANVARCSWKCSEDAGTLPVLSDPILFDHDIVRA